MSDTPIGTVSQVGENLYDLRFERHYALAAAKVWSALTDPERIADWFADADVELRRGGRFSLSGNCCVDGVVVEIDAPRLLAWTWPHPAHPDSVVRWELDEEASGCRLVLTQTSLGRNELLSIAAGWHTHLEGLPLATEGVRTPWTPENEAVHEALYRAVLPAAEV